MISINGLRAGDEATDPSSERRIGVGSGEILPPDPSVGRKGEVHGFERTGFYGNDVFPTRVTCRDSDLEIAVGLGMDAYGSVFALCRSDELFIDGRIDANHIHKKGRVHNMNTRDVILCVFVVTR